MSHPETSIAAAPMGLVEGALFFAEGASLAVELKMTPLYHVEEKVPEVVVVVDVVGVQ